MIRTHHTFAILLCATLPIADALAETEIVPVHPAEGDFVEAGGFMVVAGIAADDLPHAPRVEMRFDGAEVDSMVHAGEGFVRWTPISAPAAAERLYGKHTVQVALYDTAGALHAEREWSFTIIQSPAESVGMAARAPVRGRDGRLFAEARHYALASDGAAFEVSGGGTYRGYAGRLRYGADLRLANLNDRMSQDRNRYSAHFALGRALRVKVGDVRPSFQAAVIDGMRLRGVEAGVGIVARSSGAAPVSMDFALGRARRAVEPRWNPLDSSWDAGTYARTVGAARLNLGTGRAFRLAFSVLKGTDDASSIAQTRDSLWSWSDSAYHHRLGRAPEDNVVVGAEMVARFAERRLELRGGYALSLYTRDVNGGSITRDDLEEALGNVPVDPATFSKLLVVNTSTTPLYPGSGILNSSMITAGAELDLPLGSARERLRFDYRLQGANYHSMGSPLLGPPRQGFRAEQTLYLLDNRLSVRGWFEQYHNNLDGVQAAATTMRQGGGAIGFFHSPRVPGLTVDFSRSSSRNPDTLYGFGSGVNTVNASVVHHYRLIAFGGVAQAFTGWTGVHNDWRAHHPDSLWSPGTDTSVGFTTGVHGLSARADLDGAPLSLSGGLMTNTGSGRMLRLFTGSAEARYGIVPELLTINGGVRLGLTRMPDEPGRFHVRVPYGAGLSHRAGHELRFSGYASANGSAWDFVNTLKYEWRF